MCSSRLQASAQQPQRVRGFMQWLKALLAEHTGT